LRTVAGSTRARASGLEHVGGAVAELHLDPPAMQEIELLLLVVIVAAGLVPRRQHDRVHPEGAHPERAPDLAEPIAFAHLVDVADRVALALDHALRVLGHLQTEDTAAKAKLPRPSVS
jgi:hypothetical protein